MSVGTLVRRPGLWQPLLVAATGLVGVGYVGAVDPNRPGHYPTCPFLAVTGYYCPGCGSLRAIHALAHGDLLEAVHRNPFTVALVPLAAWVWVAWVRRVVTGRPMAEPVPPWVGWTLLTTMLAFWVMRNLPGFAWLAP
jgi:hypothetical protein